MFFQLRTAGVWTHPQSLTYYKLLLKIAIDNNYPKKLYIEFYQEQIAIDEARIVALKEVTFEFTDPYQ